MRNATKKASALIPVPSHRAKIISLKNPKIRDQRVPTDKTETDFMMALWESGPLVIVSEGGELSVDIKKPFCYIGRSSKIKIYILGIERSHCLATT